MEFIRSPNKWNSVGFDKSFWPWPWIWIILCLCCLKSEVSALWLGRADWCFLGPSWYSVTKCSWEHTSLLLLLLSLCKGSGLKDRANKCVWKNDVSSLLFFTVQKLECKAAITGKHCHALALWINCFTSVQEFQKKIVLSFFLVKLEPYK